MNMYYDVLLGDGLRNRQEARLGDHGFRHAEEPVLARVGVPVRAQGAALDLSTELLMMLVMMRVTMMVMIMKVMMLVMMRVILM